MYTAWMDIDMEAGRLEIKQAKHMIWGREEKGRRLLFSSVHTCRNVGNLKNALHHLHVQAVLVEEYHAGQMGGVGVAVLWLESV